MWVLHGWVQTWPGPKCSIGVIKFREYIQYRKTTVYIHILLYYYNYFPYNYTVCVSVPYNRSVTQYLYKYSTVNSIYQYIYTWYSGIAICKYGTGTVPHGR